MGKAVVFIDPHGDDAKDLIDAIPARYQEKFCYYDLSSLTHPVPFNIFDNIHANRIATRAANAAEGFRDIWYKAWSERMSSFLLNGLTVLAEHNLTLPDLNSLYIIPSGKEKTPLQIRTEQRRQSLLNALKNPSARNFWLIEHPNYPDVYKREAPGAILARVGQLTASPHCYASISRTHSTLNFKQALDNNYIVVINLAKGIIGGVAASIMGCLIISQIRSTIMERAETPPEERKTAALYITEFQSFATLTLAQMLSEIRKYKLQIVLENQYLSQLEPEILHAILGNVGSLISFAVGPTDAEPLAKYFDLRNPSALTDQLPFHAYLKRGLDAKVILTNPFYADNHNFDALVAASRRRFSV